MRNVDAGIVSSEAGRVLRPRHEAVVWRDILSFAAPVAQSNVLLDTSIPQTYMMGGTATTCYAAYRYTNGRAYVKAIDPTVATDWALTTAGATELDNAGSSRPVMRYGLGSVNGAPACFAATHGSTGIRVKSKLLVAPHTESDYGPVFGPPRSDTPGNVTRVEAICPTEHGVIVAVGTHLFDGVTYPHKLSTVRFWWITNAGAEYAWPLHTIIQADPADSYTNWYSCAKWATFVSAIAVGNGIVIVAYNGRHAITWTVRHGIESEPRVIPPVDPDTEAVMFRPSALTKVNNLYYLAGRMTRRATVDGAVTSGYDTSYDCYLISADSETWSLGERSHYITSDTCAGTLLMAGSPLRLYYGGNCRCTSAALGITQDPGATAITLAGRVMPGWSVQQIANGADRLSNLRLRNDDGAFGGGAPSHAVVREGSVIRLRTGQGDMLTDFGVYGIDDATGGTRQSGRAYIELNGRDLGGKTLASWRCPADVALRGRQVARSAFENLDGWIRKTPERPRDEKSAVQHLTTDAENGLVFSGLNDPVVLYSDAVQSPAGDGLTKLTARFRVAAGPFLSAIGVLIGCGDNDVYGGEGTMVLIPRQHSWAGHQQDTCKIQRLNLNPLVPAEPDKEDTGYMFKRDMNGLWESVRSGNSGKRTLPIMGETRVSLPPNLEEGQWYDLAVRVAGARVQVYRKIHDYEPASCANNAGYMMVSEFLFDHQARKRLTAGRSYTGLALGTDVFVDTSAFAHAVYDDVSLSLTEACAADASYYQTEADGGWEVNNEGPTNQVVGVYGYNMSQFAPGRHIRVEMNYYGHPDAYGTIAAVSGNIIYCVNNITTGPNQGSYGGVARVYLASREEWAFATSRAKNHTEYGGAIRLQDPGAVKGALMMYGVGCVVSNDNTALSIRNMKSDGVTHWLLNAGWDATWPGGVGTAPSAWRIVFHHNRIMAGWVSEAHGLPVAGHMKCDDEVFRYVQQAFQRFNGSVEKWTLIPTFYSVVQAQAAPSSVYSNYYAGSDWVGRDFDEIGSVTNPVGLLAQLESRAALGGFRLPVEEPPQQMYVMAQTNHSVTVGVYDRPFGSLVNHTPEVQADLADMLVLSGRGQFGTGRAGHSPRAPVLYYPCGADGKPASIQIRHYAHFSGAYQSVQDVIRRVCGLAGMRGAQFRTAFVSPGAPITLEITTTPYTLPLREPMANFVLDMDVHIPANGTGTGMNEGRLNITFRNYYRLSIEQMNTPEQVAAMQLGHIRVMLSTTSTDIAPPELNDYRWLEHVTVPVCDFNPCGAYAGTHPNYVAIDDVANNVNVRLCVQDNLIQVDINRQLIWVFDLDRMVAEDGRSYRRDTPGPISLSYTRAIPGNSATVMVSESGLGAEANEVLLRDGETARSAIDRLAGELHIKDIANQSGGRVFSQWWVRDTASMLRHNLLRHEWSRSDYAVSGHHRVIGRAAGEALNEAEIRDAGYTYESAQAQVETIGTVLQAHDEARLRIREQREYAQQDTLSGYGRIDLQPEDKVSLMYAPGGDVPAKPSSDHVVTSVTLTATAAAMQGRYTLRRYIDA